MAHTFSYGLLAVLAAGLLLGGPATAQSPSPLGVSPDPAASGVAAPSAGAASPTDPPGDTAPLPARIVEGTCDQLGDLVVDLLSVVAGGPPDSARPTVYASISALDTTLSELTTGSRVLIVGGESDPDSAVACGALEGPAQGPDDLAVALQPLHSSAYSGTALLHQGAGGSWVYLVVVAAPQVDGPAGSPSPNGSSAPIASAQASPDTSMQPGDLSPTRSVEPGTSGAPAFSPLPAASSAP